MLDKKSSIYSDRPTLQMGGELVGWKNTTVLLSYGDRFRRSRRLFHRIIGNNATVKQFLPLEELQTRQFLRRVLAKPADLPAHIRWYVRVLHYRSSVVYNHPRTAGSIILRISYGYDVQDTDDPFIELADKATDQFSLSTAPGAFMVDLIPACNEDLLTFAF